MDFKLLLLGLLRRQEMHGYGLLEFIERALPVCTDLKKPTAYYLLSRMAQDGWIREELGQEGNRPLRRVFHLTEVGEQTFQSLLRENLSRYVPASFPGDYGLAFLDCLDLDECIRLLHERRASLAAALEATQMVPLHGGSFSLVIEHQAYHLETELAWLDRLLERLSNGRISQE